MRFVLALGMLVLFSVAPVQATTWTVNPAGGADFTSISQAVNDVSVQDGDVLSVTAGTYDYTTYPGMVVITPPSRDLDVTIQSTHATDNVILDAEDNAVQFLAQSNYDQVYRLDEFTFQDYGDHVIHGLHVSYVSLTDCVFTGCTVKQVVWDAGGGESPADGINLLRCSFDCNDMSILYTAVEVFLEDYAVLGDHDITISGCDFDGAATAVQINGDNDSGDDEPFDITIYDTDFTDGGVAINIYECQEDGTDYEIEDCTVSDHDGGYYDNSIVGIGSSGDVLVDGCSFTDCAAARGGAIQAWKTNLSTDYAQVTVQTSTFLRCTASATTAPSGGGAIYIDSGCELVVSTLSEFEACTAKYGGAIAIDTADDVAISDTDFDDCEATTSGANGGAIYVEDTDLPLDDCDFVGCEANTYGGAIYFSGEYHLSWDGGVATTCKMVSNPYGHGSVAVVEDGATAVFENLTFTNCDCTPGSNSRGAIFADCDSLGIDTCTFTNCDAGQGGGVAIDDIESHSTIKGCTFEDCDADLGGGGLFVLSTPGGLKVHNTDFEDCTAGEDGGGIYRHGGSGDFLVSYCDIDDCDATGDGGGVGLNNGTVSLYNTDFSYCTAEYGGGAYVERGTLEIDYSDFDDCSADYGGAVCGVISATVEIFVSFITDCDATYDGGGIMLWSASVDDMDADISGAYVVGCTAGDDGGGMFLGASRTGPNYYQLYLDLDYCEIEGNEADDDGGGAYLFKPYMGSCTYNMFAGNAASSSGSLGGGLFMYGADEEEVFEHCTIAWNYADYGGGAYIDEELLTDFTFDEVILYSNGSDNDGDDLYSAVSQGDVSFNCCDVSDDDAQVYDASECSFSHCIYQDPEFCATTTAPNLTYLPYTDGNYMFEKDSPCARSGAQVTCDNYIGYAAAVVYCSSPGGKAAPPAPSLSVKEGERSKE